MEKNKSQIKKELVDAIRNPKKDKNFILFSQEEKILLNKPIKNMGDHDWSKIRELVDSVLSEFLTELSEDQLHSLFNSVDDREFRLMIANT